MELNFSRMALRTAPSEIRQLLKWTRQPGVVSFAGGLPDASLFPIDDLVAITEEVLRTKGYHALQYGPTPGEPELLEALAAHMNSFDDPVRPEQICVTSSSQQGLDLLSLLFLEEGSPIIVELPSYIGALQAFNRMGADLRGVPLEPDGISLEGVRGALERLSAEGKKPRFIYVIPDFQNPAGITMSVEKRQGLIRLAREAGVLIVEDSPYRELKFEGESLPSIWKLSGGEGVILLKTLSKTLFPGMRLGWVAAGPEVLERIVLLKQSVDLCSPSFNQFIIARYVAQGKMRATIERAIACYRPKRDAMVAALTRHMPAGVSWSRPEGGMFLWVTLPQKMDAKEIFEPAALGKVVYVTGRQFHCDGGGANTMRLNYSFPSLEQIETGIERLGGVIRERI